MNDIAISIKNVSKYYKLYNSPQDRLKEALSFSGKTYHKKFYATKDLNLEIKKGEILGIVGKNGSGKSTLLKLITNVLSPSKGSIKVNGKISALLELGSGFNPEFTGMQNIFFYGTILGFTKKEMDDKLDDIIAFADIGDFIDQPLKTYSSGMKSRLGFAVAVHIDPEILILDEVLSVGDILFKRKCYAKMEEFFNGGKTIIYVSHDGNSVNQLCSRAIFLMDGSILMDSDAKTVTQFYEKFLFANRKEQESLKNELMQSNTKPKDINKKLPAKKSLESHKTVPSLNTKEKSLNGDQYLPKLVSTPDYINSNIASFDNISIRNDQNDMVNVLQLNHRYKLTFTVTWHQDLENVFFGARFLTLKGVVMSGVNNKHYYTNKPLSVKNNETFNIEIEFDCLLLPETYIIRLFTSDEDTWSIVNDAYMFKVKSTPWTQGGHVHLKQTININKLDGESILEKLL